MSGLSFTKFPKVCPKCDATALDHFDIEAIFGYRQMNGVSRPQSYCRGCRSNKKTDAQAIRNLVESSPVTVLGSIPTASTGGDLLPKKAPKSKTPKVRTPLAPPSGTPLEIVQEFVKRLTKTQYEGAADETMEQIDEFLKVVSTEDLEDLNSYFTGEDRGKFNYGRNQMSGFLADELYGRRIEPEPLSIDALNELYRRHYPGDKQVRSTRTKAARLTKKLATDSELVERLARYR